MEGHRTLDPWGSGDRDSRHLETPSGFLNSESKTSSVYSEKPLPLDPKWAEVKRTLEAMKGENERSGSNTHVPIKIDRSTVASPTDPDVRPESYYDLVANIVRSPSNSGDHIKTIEVKDNGDHDPDYGEDLNFRSRIRPNSQMSADDYLNNMSSMSNMNNRRSFNPPPSEPQYSLPLVRRHSALTLSSINSNKSGYVAPPPPKQAPFDPKNEQSVYRLVRSGLFDPEQPKSSQPQEEKVSRLSIKGLMNAHKRRSHEL